MPSLRPWRRDAVDYVPQYTDAYAELTNCSLPIFTDTMRRFHDVLGIARAWLNGSVAAGYLHFARRFVKSPCHIFPSTPDLRTLSTATDPTKALHGDPRQQGGEFLFEPSPTEPGDKLVTWCHRMQNSEDHTPHAELVKDLDVKG